MNIEECFRLNSHKIKASDLKPSSSPRLPKHNCMLSDF